MTLRWPLVGWATLIEAALLVLAAFGGPHGQLGAVPWVLQFPGILLLLYPPGGVYFAIRVGIAALLQTCLWYLALSGVRRWRVRRAGSAA